MTKWIKGFIYIFILVTGSIAGAGLLIMDGVLNDLLNPVFLSEDSPEAVFPEDVNAQIMNVRIDEDVYARGYYVDVPGSDFVVLFSHDCNGNMFHRFELMRHFIDLGVSVMAVDFRGFGLSDEVEISDEAFHKDMEKIFSATRRKKWSSSRIIIYGQGISVGIQGELVKKNQCALWVMDNPIPSLSDSTDSAIGKFLTVDRLTVFPALEEGKTPVLICYDENLVSEATIGNLQEKCPDCVVLKVKGGRTRGSFDDSDWALWKTSIQETLSTLNVPSKAGQTGPVRVPPQKGEGDKIEPESKDEPGQEEASEPVDESEQAELSVTTGVEVTHGNE